MRSNRLHVEGSRLLLPDASHSIVRSLEGHRGSASDEADIGPNRFESIRIDYFRHVLQTRSPNIRSHLIHFRLLAQIQSTFTI